MQNLPVPAYSNLSVRLEEIEGQFILFWTTKNSKSYIKEQIMYIVLLTLVVLWRWLLTSLEYGTLCTDWYIPLVLEASP